MRALPLFLLFLVVGCLASSRVVHTAPAGAESLSCARQAVQSMGYTVHGDAAPRNGFTAELRSGSGETNLSREVLLVGHRGGALHVTATAARVRAEPAAVRRLHPRQDPSSRTLQDAAQLIAACAAGGD